MLIGELVKKSGLSKDTIRFYEKKGLIHVDSKYRRENNYKEYPQHILNKLLLIRQVKNLGFTLNEIESFFRSWQEEGASCENLKATLEDKMKTIDSEIDTLLQQKNRLVSSLQKCKNDDCEFEKLMPSCIIRK